MYGLERNLRHEESGKKRKLTRDDTHKAQMKEVASNTETISRK
jgi:hypothetical protein